MLIFLGLKNGIIVDYRGILTNSSILRGNAAVFLAKVL